MRIARSQRNRPRRHFFANTCVAAFAPIYRCFHAFRRERAGALALRRNFWC